MNTRERRAGTPVCSGTEYRLSENSLCRARLSKPIAMQPDVNANARSSPRVWVIKGDQMRIESSEPAQASAPFKLLLQVSGVSALRQGGRKTVLAPEGLAFIDGAAPFALEADGDFEQVVVSLSRGLVTSLYRNIERRTAIAYVDAGAQPLVREVMHAYAAASLQMDARAHVHATVAITHLLGAMNPPGAQTSADRSYLRALALIDTQIDRVDAQDVARQLGVSRRYLDKLFHRTGRSFATHLWDRRIALAAEWLQRPGPISITEVAHGVGFKDSSHFARMFRSRYGQSPRHWMQTNASKRNSSSLERAS